MWLAIPGPSCSVQPRIIIAQLTERPTRDLEQSAHASSLPKRLLLSSEGGT
jgi:hypothetical protein